MSDKLSNPINSILVENTISTQIRDLDLKIGGGLKKGSFILIKKPGKFDHDCFILTNLLKNKMKILIEDSKDSDLIVNESISKITNISQLSLIKDQLSAKEKLIYLESQMNKIVFKFKIPPRSSGGLLITASLSEFKEKITQEINEKKPDVYLFTTSKYQGFESEKKLNFLFETCRNKNILLLGYDDPWFPRKVKMYFFEYATSLILKYEKNNTLSIEKNRFSGPCTIDLNEFVSK